jgi:nucleoside-diphosphate-sugar epimerase
MDSSNSGIVLVTGASGYVASHCIKILLEQGHKVRGSVRSLANKHKYKFLYELVPEKNENLTLVEADLQDENSWVNAVDGCTYVLHVASPIPPYVPKDENEVIKPAVDGTVNVMNAAMAKGVKRIIVTSSCLTLLFGNEGQLLTEEHWADPNKCPAAYPKSKILAEKAAWDLWEKNKDKIEFATVLPSLVFGPVFTKHSNSSETLMAEMMKNTYPGIPDPDCNYAVVDVRDAAEAHVKALFSKEANGKRYIAAGENLTTEGLINILKGEYEKHGYSFPSKKVTAQEIKESGNPVAQRALMAMGKVMKLNNERSIKDLGMKYHKVEDTVLDMAKSLFKQGIIEDKTSTK